MPKRILMRDVAAKAGVSTMTVSRVMSDSDHVKPETRRRVLQVIKELDYNPESSARALAKGVTGNYGFWVSSSQGFDDLFRDIEKSIQIELAQHDISLLTFRSSNQARELPSMITQRKVDGVIAFGYALDAETVYKIESYNVPVVLISTCLKMEGISSIDIDYYGGAFQAVDHLLGLGHRKVAFLGQQPQDFCSTQMYYGYCAAFHQAKVPLRPELVFRARSSRADGFELGEQISAAPSLASAVFCCSDLLAVGVMEALARHQVRIPRDFSVIGFGDSELATVVRPQLSSVKVDHHEIGSLATRILLAKRKDPESPVSNHTCAAHLIIRESCGARPARVDAPDQEPVERHY